jgi:hypothetical protein
MRFAKLAIVALALSYGAHANAGFLLEPYIGYAAGTLSGSSSVAGVTVTGGDATGVGYGARVGYALPLVWFAADYTMYNLTIKTGSASNSGTGTNLAADVGVSLPFVRLWGGYTVGREIKSNNQTYKGKGLKAGIGLSFIPMLSINLEYLMTTYDAIAITGAGNVTLKDNTAFVSVSVPFDL